LTSDLEIGVRDVKPKSIKFLISFFQNLNFLFYLYWRRLWSSNFTSHDYDHVIMTIKPSRLWSHKSKCSHLQFPVWRMILIFYYPDYIVQSRNQNFSWR